MQELAQLVVLVLKLVKPQQMLTFQLKQLLHS
jgi:hypothetical protein